MQTIFEKRAVRSSVKKNSSTSKNIDTTREAKIILYDCLQPQVLLEIIKWPPKNDDDAIISDHGSQCSSQDETVFRGFGSTDDFHSKRYDATPKTMDDDATTSSIANLHLISKLVPCDQNQLDYIFKEVAARLAVKNEKKANHTDDAYGFVFDEGDGGKNNEDYQSLIENNDGDAISSGQTLTATDSEFCSLSNCTDVDAYAGSYAVGEAMTDDCSYTFIETVDTSDFNVAHMVDVNSENVEDDDFSDDEFYEAEEEQGDVESRIASVMSAPPNMTTDVEEEALRFAYGSDDSWNSVAEFKELNIVSNRFDNKSNGNHLFCTETMDDSTSQDGFDDETENRKELVNGRPLLTNILDLIESNRSVNRTESGKRIGSIHLFCNVCIRNLIDGCYDINCQFSHILPTNDIVLNNLESASIEDVNEAYHELLLRYPKLLEQYFRVFCVFYGNKKYRTQLRDMSHVCAQSENAESFMLEIINAFVSTGMPYSTAVDVLIKELTSNGYDARYRILVLSVALNPRNTKLLEHLHNFETIFIDSNCNGHKDAVEKLVQANLNEHVESLMEYTLDVLAKCMVSTLLQINQNLLKSFLDTAETFGLVGTKRILHCISAARGTH